MIHRLENTKIRFCLKVYDSIACSSVLVVHYFVERDVKRKIYVTIKRSAIMRGFTDSMHVLMFLYSSKSIKPDPLPFRTDPSSTTTFVIPYEYFVVPYSCATSYEKNQLSYWDSYLKNLE